MPVIPRIQNQDQWVVVTGHYIDCTVPAQYTHLAWLNLHSDRENGGNKFLWRAGIHLWDRGVTTHNSSLQNIIQFPVTQFVTFPGWIVILQCSLCSSDSLEKKLEISLQVSQEQLSWALILIFHSFPLCKKLQKIILQFNPTACTLKVSSQRAQTQVFSTLGFLFQFQNSHNWWVFGGEKVKHPLCMVFGQLWIWINQQKTELLSAVYFRC